MENISVSIRVRPLNKLETQDSFSWRIDGNTICQLDPNNKENDGTINQTYVLDHVFGPERSTHELYETTAQGLIYKVMDGFNGTVLAYGQTSSGKTHTMRGTSESPGLISLAVEEAFKLIKQKEDRNIVTHVSYMELYNEKLYDLLSNDDRKLTIKENKDGSPFVSGLSEHEVKTVDDVLLQLDSGDNRRHTGSTRMNENSSRSHSIFRMVFKNSSKNEVASANNNVNDGSSSNPDGADLVSVLTLVDLAGSERVAKTGAEGLRMKEGMAINRGLFTLGEVIKKLSRGALENGGHIPYRDSKLTRILQPSLGGNAKTAIICAMTPALMHVEESHSTLRFACQAKSVKNQAVVNVVLSAAALQRKQANEIEELRKQLRETQGENQSEENKQLKAQIQMSEQRGAL
eukprot:CAMPEP_0175057860 /NCGR_PEP_ID=MMETSP0052_2-20121109/11500_1 /TAXON_ID=51329 ORGANISM="Polytomella parva, Strain SAG 63-3" /NCGR_SAMPLE_ID=MMETSP0052_2 /ASSEMBLY_ACC=CAM_ASM_000194 /LENGTH=403 /DNA_ID=CAMNT_0016323123 /DNA_START=109 /DNA_END=1316 /DNA_ORIENTATION=-